MKPEKKYFRLERTDRNLYTVETITVVGNKITNTEHDEPTYLPIAFDKMRRKTGESYFEAVKEESGI